MFTLTLSTGSMGDAAAEIAEILVDLADQLGDDNAPLEPDTDRGRLFDRDRNTIGSWRYVAS